MKHGPNELQMSRRSVLQAAGVAIVGGVAVASTNAASAEAQEPSRRASTGLTVERFERGCRAFSMSD